MKCSTRTFAHHSFTGLLMVSAILSGLGCASEDPSPSATSSATTSADTVDNAVDLARHSDIKVGPGIRIVSPDRSYYGMTYGDWSAAFWQWHMGIPFIGHPANGGDCSVENAGPVWFLTGTPSATPVTRDCTVPVGTSLFFVMGSTECSNAIDGDHAPFGTSEIELYRCAVASEFGGGQVHESQWAVSVDGYDVTTPPETFRNRSPMFDFQVPAGSIFNAWWHEGDPVPGTYQAVHFGRSVMFEPFERGSHVLHILVAYSGGPTEDITYNLTVQ